MLDPGVAWSRCRRTGETIGEIMFRGNLVMKGYLKNEKATAGVLRRRLVPHRRPRPSCTRDGYVKIKDRSKDVIISGGENVLVARSPRTCSHRHPAVVPPPSSQARRESGAGAGCLHRTGGRGDLQRSRRDHRIARAAPGPLRVPKPGRLWRVAQDARPARSRKYVLRPARQSLAIPSKQDRVARLELLANPLGGEATRSPATNI